MARPKKQTFHEAREEVAQEIIEKKIKVDDKEAKVLKMIEETKLKMAGKKYVMFKRVDSKGEPMIFTMSAHQTSLSAQLVTKYQMKGYQLVHSTITPIQSDDRVLKLFNATNFVQVPLAQYNKVASLSIEEMNKQQLAKEIENQKRAAQQIQDSLEMRDE
jgi:transposase-like protein